MGTAVLAIGLVLTLLLLPSILGRGKLPHRQGKTFGLPAEIIRRRWGRGAFRRRSAARVLVTSGFILLTVWGMRYAETVGETILATTEHGRPQPWWTVFDPWFIARTCPQALAVLLAAVVGFSLILRWKPLRLLERLILEALGATTHGGDESSPALADDASMLPSPPAPLPDVEGKCSRRQSWTWIVLGLLTVAAALVIVERIEPYYFVQDDNFANILPAVLQGCRSIFQGEFPDFDPCQLMGIPSAGKGLYAIFYPPTVISYAIARWGLRNEFYTLEVFAAMHLLLGYLASYAAARSAGIRPALAYVLGISYVLSGYMILVGRSWNNVLTLVVWLPLLFCCLQSWLKGRANWRWLWAAGLTIAGLYYVGFALYFVYGMLLVGLTAMVAVICGRVAVRQLIWPIAASLLGVALILPTLTVQLAITHGMAEKEANFGKGIEQGLLAMLAPFPFTHAEGFMVWPTNKDPVLETQWYYAGTFLMACAFLGMGIMLAYRCRRAWLGENPWMVTAIAALWLGLGKEGILWTVVGGLPMIHAINHHPHRLMPFILFYCLIAGGVFLERLLRSTASRKWEYLIAAATVVLMFYHVSLARNALWCYGDRPYPELPREIAQRVLPSQNPQAGRVWWFGPFRSGLPGFAYALPFSLPSAYGAYGFGGYDPISELRPETEAFRRRFEISPAEAGRAYGIRWALVANADYFEQEWEYWWTLRKSKWGFGFSDPDWPEFQKKFLPAAQLRFRCQEVSLYELPDASPMAFEMANPQTPIPIEFHGWGAEVNVHGSGPRTVVVNIVDRPWLRAACGKQPLESKADSWGRLEVHVPEGVSRFQVFYDLPWRRGVFAALGLAGATIGGMVLIRKRI